MQPNGSKLHRGQIIFTYLHLAADPEQTHDLMASGVTAIAYETVTDAAGKLPLLAPMSTVAGRMAPQVAAHFARTAARRTRNSAGRDRRRAGRQGRHSRRRGRWRRMRPKWRSAWAPTSPSPREAPKTLRHLSAALWRARRGCRGCSRNRSTNSAQSADVVIGAALVAGARRSKADLGAHGQGNEAGRGHRRRFDRPRRLRSKHRIQRRIHDRLLWLTVSCITASQTCQAQCRERRRSRSTMRRVHSFWPLRTKDSRAR